MKRNKHIALWFEGAMQSWGVDAKFNTRTSQDFPSKSAVLGIVLASMGRIGEQREFLAAFDQLDMKVLAYSPSGCHAVQQTDFQVIGSGQNEKDIWQSMFIPRRGNGSRPKMVRGNKIIHKKFIGDMCYGVSLEIPSDYEDEIITGLEYPVYSPYLGRKAYTPSDVIYRDVFETPEMALKHIEDIAILKKAYLQFKVYQGHINGGEVITINDQPTCFGSNRKYKLRTITLI